MKQMLTVAIGGVPLFRQMLDIQEPQTAGIVHDGEDFGLDYGFLEEGETGEYFKKKIVEAGELDDTDKQSYQYALATAMHPAVELIETADAVALQKALNSFGYHLKVDGIKGKKTKAIYYEVLQNYGRDAIEEEYAYFMHHVPPDKRDYVEIAFAELGTLEWSHGSNPEVEKYHNAVGGKGWTDSIAWCGSFVGYVLKKAGYALPQHPYRALSWLEYGKSSFIPVYGAIAVKRRKGGGHVGFVVGMSEDARYVDVLGGNQHDSVNVTRYRTSAFQEFRIPDGYDTTKELVPYFEAQKVISES